MKRKNLGDQPIEEAYHAQMSAIAKALDEMFNGKIGKKKTAFVLLTAHFGDIKDSRVNYISNAERTDTLAMMKEFIARAEGRYVETDDAAEKGKQS